MENQHSLLLETTPNMDNNVQMDAGVASHASQINLQGKSLKLADTSRIQIQIQIMIVIVMIREKVIVMILEIVRYIPHIRVDRYTVCYHRVDSRIRSLKKMMNLKNIQNENKKKNEKKKVKGKKKNAYRKRVTDSC